LRGRVHLVDAIFGAGQHAAGAAAGVVDVHRFASAREFSVVLRHQQLDHKADDLARGEVLAGVLIAGFVEFADELFEDQAHLGIADGTGVQVDVFEALHDQIKQIRFVKSLDRIIEVEAFNDFAHVFAEAGDVIAQVIRQLRRVSQEKVKVVTRSTVKGIAGFAAKQVVKIVDFVAYVSQGFQHILPGRR